MGGSRTWRIRSLTVEHGMDGLWDASDASKRVMGYRTPFGAILALAHFRRQCQRAGIK